MDTGPASEVEVAVADAARAGEDDEALVAEDTGSDEDSMAARIELEVGVALDGSEALDVICAIALDCEETELEASKAAADEMDEVWI